MEVTCPTCGCVGRRHSNGRTKGRTLGTSIRLHGYLIKSAVDSKGLAFSSNSWSLPFLVVTVLSFERTRA